MQPTKKGGKLELCCFAIINTRVFILFILTLNVIPSGWLWESAMPLNCGVLSVAPGTLAGRECGESRTVLGFTIFSTSINQASRNSPVPSGSSGCSKPSDTDALPPMDRAQLNVLVNKAFFTSCKKYNNTKSKQQSYWIFFFFYSVKL